jgi:chromosome segregation ATPase
MNKKKILKDTTCIVLIALIAMFFIPYMPLPSNANILRRIESVATWIGIIEGTIDRYTALINGYKAELQTVNDTIGVLENTVGFYDDQLKELDKQKTTAWNDYTAAGIQVSLARSRKADAEADRTEAGQMLNSLAKRETPPPGAVDYWQGRQLDARNRITQADADIVNALSAEAIALNRCNNLENELSLTRLQKVLVLEAIARQTITKMDLERMISGLESHRSEENQRLDNHENAIQILVELRQKDGELAELKARLTSLESNSSPSDEEANQEIESLEQDIQNKNAEIKSLEEKLKEIDLD